MSHVQKDGGNAREDEAHVGCHGHGDHVAAGTAGIGQGRDDQMQRLRGDAAKSKLAFLGRAVSELREFQYGRGKDYDAGRGGA